MGFRFRKSVKAGPFRMTFSKSGVGYSVGGKGFRVTKKPKGGIRTTASIPGTGISYSKDYGKGHKHQKSNNNETSPSPTQRAPILEKHVPVNAAIEFYLCLFLGWAGAHKFYRKKIGAGFLYLFTVGLFGIGWVIDIVKTLIQSIRASK